MFFRPFFLHLFSTFPVLWMFFGDQFGMMFFYDKDLCHMFGGEFVIKCIGFKFDYWFKNGLGVLVVERLHAVHEKKRIF